MFYSSDRFQAKQKELNKIWKAWTKHQVKISFFESFDLSKWKMVLYLRKRKHIREDARDRKKMASIIKALRDVGQYIDKLKASSLAELKLKCLYVDLDERTLKFRVPSELPSKVARGLIRLARSHIRDTQELRDTFRRAKTNLISNDIIESVTERQQLEQLYQELSNLTSYDQQ